ncbi:MAG: hypothetical protein IIC74_12535 [Bacteroidetes bacterium]|nr:hypothetical protein [Bacteroidota bacterium]
MGLFSLKKYKRTVVKYFIYFLIYVAFVDFIGGYPKYLSKTDSLKFIYKAIKDTIFINNYWWFTLFWTIGSALFFSFYFRLILINKLYKSILKYACILLIIVSILHIVVDYMSFVTSFIISIEAISFCIILLCSCFYFVEIINSQEILFFYKSINFYIAAVILIWWIITTPLMFYNMYFTSSDWTFVLLKREIILLANIFMYSSFTIALLWCKPQND